MNANTSLVEISAAEQKLASRVDNGVTSGLSVSDAAGGISFRNAGEVMEFAKLMSLSHVAVPKHLRGNPGACLAVTIQAIEWRLSPYAVANKSYSVNDRLAYESQLIQAVILQRAPIKGRFRFSFSGEGIDRRCKVEAITADGELVDYESPSIKEIPVKNSPLWKSDPDQQLTYYAGRALCRRHFPDVLLGVYDRDELDDEPRNPAKARDVTPAPRSLGDKLDALAAPAAQRAADEPFRKEPEAGSSITQTVSEGDQDGSPQGGDVQEQREPAGDAGAAQEPTTADEYLDYAEAWIIAAVDADAAEAQWRDEKRLRAKLGVSVDDAKALAEKLTARARALRGNQ